jgi:hypothetical protein
MSYKDTYVFTFNAYYVRLVYKYTSFFIDLVIKALSPLLNSTTAAARHTPPTL